MHTAGMGELHVQPRTERERDLARGLAAQGVDVRRLEFLRWLVANGRHPEWIGDAAVRSNHRVP